MSAPPKPWDGCVCGRCSPCVCYYQLRDRPSTMDPCTSFNVSVPLFRPSLHSIPVIKPEELVEADGLIFGFPTRFGQPAAQMRALWDATGGC